MSLRDRILAAQDLGSKLVEVPEWGVTLEMRGMDAATSEALSDAATEGGQSWLRSVIVASAHDPETGEQVFTQDDVDALGAKSSAVIARLWQEALDVSKLSDEARVEAGKDSPSTPPDDSSSS